MRTRCKNLNVTTATLCMRIGLPHSVQAARISSTGINLRKIKQNHGRIYSQQGPVQKKVRALHLGRQTLFFLEKNWRPFSQYRPVCQVSVLLKNWRLFSQQSSLSFTRDLPIISGMQKNRRSFCGALFCGGPASVRPSMLNMPKSAAE